MTGCAGGAPPRTRPPAGIASPCSRRRWRSALRLAQPLEALDHANVALKTQGDFVPAALLAGRLEINRGESRRAASLLRRVWRATNHPDIALLYANSTPGASAVERFKRIRELIEMPPPDTFERHRLRRAAQLTPSTG